MRAEPVVQTEAIIGGTRVVLARSEDRQVLRREIEEASATGGCFVDIEAADGSEVSVFVTAGTPVSFHTRIVTPAEPGAAAIVLSNEGNWDLL